jgi:GntR family transcriptional regulator, transcriptional repressor for pyruvate dehydrogenase complex
MNKNSKMFEALPKGPIPEIIINRITNAIIDGELKPGDKIPTEIEFSEILGVGRNSVREAIKVMVSFGVLEIRRAEGTFVVENFSQNLLNPIVYGLILANKSMEDLLEFKITFLNSVLFLAIQKATDEDIDKLKEYYNAFCTSMEEGPGKIDDMYTKSKEFYQFLGEMTKNPMVIQLNEIVLKISKYSRVKAIQNSIDIGKRKSLPDNYLRIVKLIEKRDKNGIGILIDSTLKEWKDLLL